MAKKIVLSPKTIALFKKLKKSKTQANKIAAIFNLDASNTVELTALTAWLKQNEKLVLQLEDDAEAKLLLASLNANLMRNLAQSLPGYTKQKKGKTKPTWSNRLKYSLLAFAGTLFFACEGFDGITAIVGILSMSTTGLFIIGTIFSFISVMAFYAFNLTEISKNLDIHRKEARELVDRYLKEIEEINAIRKHLNNNYLKRKSAAKLEEDLAITELLIARYKALDKGRKALAKQLTNKKLTVIKYFIGLVIGVIYFSSGFFAGQAVATFLASLFVVATVPIFWPVFITSLVVGLASFSVYWFVERPSIDKLVGRWFGIDQEKIERLCDSQRVLNDKAKLENLTVNLTLRKSKASYESRLREANSWIKALKQQIARRQSGLTDESPGDLTSLGFFAEAEPKGRLVELSQKTLELINELSELGYFRKFRRTLDTKGSNTLNIRQLTQWLVAKNAVKNNEHLKLLLASLNTALLKDLSKLLPDTRKKDEQRVKRSKRNGLIYTILALAGTIYFGCEGFDGIAAIISMFSVPKLVILTAGSFFALISIMAFYAFDLTEISRNLGVKKKNVNKLVDVHLKEVAAINAIRRSLDNDYAKRTTLAELNDDLLITDLLIARYKKLDEARTSLTELLSSTKLTTLKYAIAAVIGIIYFSGGFFTGQAVALAIAGLFVASTASLFWPIFIASSAIGLAALGVYWFVERPGIYKLISRLCGLDQDKIECFCRPEKITQHNEKLVQLKNNILAYKTSMETVDAENPYWAEKLREANQTINELTLQLKQVRPEDRTLTESSRLESFSVEGDSNDEFGLSTTDFFKQPRSRAFNDLGSFLSNSC